MRYLLVAGTILMAGILPASCSSSNRTPDWTPGSQVHQDHAVLLNELSRAWELRDFAQQLEDDLAAGRWHPSPSQEAKVRRACQAAREYLFEIQRLFPWYVNLYEPDPENRKADLEARAADLRKHVQEGHAEQIKLKGELIRQSLIDALRGDSGPQ